MNLYIQFGYYWSKIIISQLKNYLSNITRLEKLKIYKKRTGMRNLSLKTILYSIYFYSTMGLERFSNKRAKITRSKLEHETIKCGQTLLSSLRVFWNSFISNEWLHLIYWYGSWERIELIVIFSSLFYKISLFVWRRIIKEERWMGPYYIFVFVDKQQAAAWFLSIRWSIEKPISNC